MSTIDPSNAPATQAELWQSYAPGPLSRRAFMQQTAAAGLTGAAAALLGAPSSGVASDTASRPNEPRSNEPIELREWSYFWLGIKRAELARGTVVGGQQLYVEYQIPARRRHPYPIVLVHGGGGQGTDWMGTPDGRPGWMQILLQEGFAVYVLDRPGHGRAPYHPDLDGPFPPAPTLEFLEGTFTPPQPNTVEPNPYQLKHTQWPGRGNIGSSELDQFAASQGGAYVQVAAPPGSAPAPMRRPNALRTGSTEPANRTPPTPGSTAAAIAHTVWRERGAELLDKIGPAIIITHSAGGPFGHLVADARPQLVKGIVVIEGGIAPF
ncbi:MAG: alpha/beta fold hydrolase, partial [Steroidobacteraceae bacterium]